LSGPFDRALAQQALRVAADTYAVRFGTPRSAAYRAAWLKFRQRIRTLEDLHRWEAAIATKAAERQRLAGAAGAVPGRDAQRARSSRHRTAPGRFAA
jgi:hypothetical protein